MNSVTSTTGGINSITMGQVDAMIAWESGTLDAENTIKLFQGLIDSGLAWSLQGCYGRFAMDLIRSGHCERR